MVDRFTKVFLVRDKIDRKMRVNLTFSDVVLRRNLAGHTVPCG